VGCGVCSACATSGVRSTERGGAAGLGQNSETVPPGLGFMCAVKTTLGAMVGVG